MNKKLIIFLIAALVITILSLFTFFNRGTLVVETKPQDALITINRKSYSTNKMIKLKPGEYSVLISKEGFADYSFSNVQIKRSENTELRRVLASEDEGRLQKDLPFDDGLTFKILARDDGEKFIYDIGLYSFLNSDSQLERYQREMVALKKEALDFIRSYQVDPGEININWLQKEAEKL